MSELDMCDILNLEDYDLSKKSGDVSVKVISAGGELSFLLDDIPIEKNLVTIAVKKYMNSIGRGGAFVFSLTKNIPSGAGLGGGSSNAAAALKIVSEMLNRENDGNINIAASATGSDVPFFIHGGFSFVEGRGESVTPVDFNDESFIVLVNNGIHIDTGLAYKSLNKTVSDISIDCESRKKSILEMISLKSEWKNLFRNDFEQSIFGLYPQIGLIKSWMYENGSFFASMTGSGSTVYGLFHEEDSAINALRILKNRGNRVYFAKFRSKKN